MALTALKLYDIQCSICGKRRSIDYGESLESSLKQIRTYAEEEGWTAGPNGQPACPICTALYDNPFAEMEVQKDNIENNKPQNSNCADDNNAVNSNNIKDDTPQPQKSNQTDNDKKAQEEKSPAQKTIEIYTDGSCLGNPGPGGWAAILQCDGYEKELTGNEKLTTNNRMELTAVVQALSAIREISTVHLYSDSKYVLDAITKGWIDTWKQASWQAGDGLRKNYDLWSELYVLIKKHKMNYHWVKGHSTNALNNRCDKLAVKQSNIARLKT